MMRLTLVATCMFGMEKLLGEEISNLGYERLSTIDGRVTFAGDTEAVALSNLFLRYAERVFILLGQFHAESFEELFDGVKEIPLENFIGKKDAFPISGHSIKSQLTSIPACQSIVKKAMVKRLNEAYHIDWFEETGIKYPIEFFILKNECSILMDTSGVTLHKRGYRTEANLAPLRETLAAAMVSLTHPKENVLLWDPFCGSGTIGIEACLMMNHTAPGLHRSFISEQYPFIPKKDFDNAREEALEVQKKSDFHCYLSDIDPQTLEIAKANAKRAGVDKQITFFVKDALRIEKQEGRGTIICNPPYGERMGEKQEVEKLYRNMGKKFPQFLPWQIYVLTSHPYFEKIYGKKADKVVKFYNGMIPCHLFEYLH